MQTGFILPTAISIVAGGADGAISAVDADHGRTEFQKQWATYYQGGLIAAAAGLGFFGAHPDVYEPLLFTGAALAARRGAFALVEHNQKSPVPAYGRKAPREQAPAGRRTEARPAERELAAAAAQRVGVGPFTDRDQPISAVG